jgi:Mg2+ transporter MgtE
MNVKKFMYDMREHIDAVIEQKDDYARTLLVHFSKEHPVDIADFLEDIAKNQAKQLFSMLPHAVQIKTFLEFSDSMKAFIVSQVSDEEKTSLLHALAPDELTDLFDQLSDDDLKAYLTLLHTSLREQVISLLQFDPESAGGVMHTDVLSLMQDFTVEKSIKLLQRVQPQRDVHERIFVTDAAHILVGYIHLADLVLQKPSVRLNSFMRQNELIARADEDQETIAKEMVHYNLMIVPVVDDKDHFLGIIPSETLVDVLVTEASKDVQKMAALTPTHLSYFKLPFARVLRERSYVLVILLLAESFSRTILHAYEEVFMSSMILYTFIPMLMSLGGNTSHQTSAIMIQGIASGEVEPDNMFRFLRRELLMAFCLSLILGIVSFIRVIMTGGTVWQGIAISVTAGSIVLCAVSLGSAIPLILKRFNMDPAFSAGPFLATIMDVLAVLIYCAMVTYLIRS